MTELLEEIAHDLKSAIVKDRENSNQYELHIASQAAITALLLLAAQLKEKK